MAMLNTIRNQINIQQLAVLLGLFLLVFSFRLMLLHDYGSSTPFFDDWEMGVFLDKFAQGQLGIIDWFTPAYQHQMLFAKIVNVVMFALNGYQWDTLNVLVFNSILWALISILLITIGYSFRNEISTQALTIFVIALWILPISIESATWAIVTNFYFMLIFLLIGYWGISYKPYSLPWKLSLVALTLASLTIGAGVFAAVPLLIIYLYRFFTETNTQARLSIKTTLFALIIVSFLCFLTTLFWKLAAGDTDHYLAADVGSFFTTLYKTLTWPLISRNWLGIFFVLPSLLLLIECLRRRLKFTPSVIFTLALTGYMTMQAIGIALVRNDAEGLNPAVRYYEVLLLSVVANFMALLVLQNRGNLLFPSNANKGLIFAWIFTLYIAIPGQKEIHRLTANEELDRRFHQTSYARKYLQTSDLTVLTDHPYFHIAYPRSYKKLAVWLDQYNQSHYLPMELQIPNKLSNNESTGFTYNATIKPVTGRYREKYRGEDVIGSYNIALGAQNVIGEYKSQTYQNTNSYIMIPTLGFLGLQGVSLEVEEMESGYTHVITPPYNEDTPEVWQHNYLKLPLGNYRIIAKDNSDKLWFGFAAPRVVGKISYFVRKYLISKQKALFTLSVIILLFAFHQPLITFLQKTNSKT